MRKYLPLLAATGVLLLSFQNCSQQGASSSSNAVNSISQTKIEDPVLSQAESLDILTREENEKVNLDLLTGELLQLSANGNERKCLPESELAKIRDLFASSALCEPQEPDEGVACAQVYTPAYSEIHWANRSIKIGEAQSSCHKGVDLCGSDANVLRGILRDIISRWDEWSCDFQVVQN